MDACMIKRSEIQNIVVAGKSGAGKQPRIDVLASQFNLQQLSTGNIFREYMGAFNKSGFKGALSQFFDVNENAFIPDTQIEEILTREKVHGDINAVCLGLKAQYFVNEGKFVPDYITNELFATYFSKSNYRGQVLDGYPRTESQAQFLLDLAREKGVNINLVVVVDNEDTLIIERTMGRRICPDCAKVYHIVSKPSKDNVHCDQCGAELIQRSDDTEEKIRMRLKEFQDKVIPALDILKNAQIPVVHINGNLAVFTDENVKKSVMEQIEPLISDE